MILRHARTIERVLWALIVVFATATAVSFYVQNQKLKVQIADRESQIAVAVAEGEAKAREAEQAAAERVNQVEIDYAAKSQDNQRALAAALGRLRDAEARAARQPASAAPATCRNYDASPDQLSLPDREILVRLGAAADEIAGRLALCAGYVGAVREVVGTD
jgi:hypothetical protein